MKTIIGAQGEITVFAVSATPAEAKAIDDPERNAAGNIIVGHSESGHHHVIAGGGDVAIMERPAPAGMKILYGLLTEPGELVQDAPSPHGKIALPAGLLEFRIAREFNPFADLARRVAD